MRLVAISGKVKLCESPGKAGGLPIFNYQGMFLRGYGGQYSYHWGQVWHGSAGIRNIIGGQNGGFYGGGGDGWGAFYGRGIQFANVGFIQNQNDCIYFSGFDASRVVSTDAENRPVNIAVRYLVRAAK